MTPKPFVFPSLNKTEIPISSASWRREGVEGRRTSLAYFDVFSLFEELECDRRSIPRS